MSVIPTISYPISGVILRAARLANTAHQGQYRKYQDNTPYVVHPGRVATRLCKHEKSTEAMVAAAWLHDVVEDTNVPIEHIQDVCGPDVANLVLWLTNPSKGMKLPRAERKMIDREHIREAPIEARMIKLVDRTDNLNDMFHAPSGFLHTYLGESMDLFEVLRGTDRELELEYWQAVNYIYDLLKERQCSEPSVVTLQPMMPPP